MMESKTRKMKSWVMVLMAILLLCASAWSFNIATFNYFAADFHNQYSRDFASRGNVFFFLAIVLIAAFVSLVVVIFRSAKKRRMVKT